MTGGEWKSFVIVMFKSRASPHANWLLGGNRALGAVETSSTYTGARDNAVATYIDALYSASRS